MNGISEEWSDFKKQTGSSGADGTSGSSSSDGISGLAGQFSQKLSAIGNAASALAMPLLQSILASTVSIWRFEIRGSIELMTGGKDSSTPWYLTIGNPYSPWLATNHIIVKSVTLDTSTEMGFNDQPQWLKATFSCLFSRSLGKQELMRMFNNSFRRSYNDPERMSRTLTSIYAEKKRENDEQSAKEQIANENNLKWWNSLSPDEKKQKLA
jgi:hypothetical protein